MLLETEPLGDTCVLEQVDVGHGAAWCGGKGAQLGGKPLVVPLRKYPFGGETISLVWGPNS